jgi:hypothetical protein
MIKITSKDIQEAATVFRKFMRRVVTIEAKTDCYEPDNKKLAKKFGLKYLGSGVYRVAYKYKNMVIKTHLGFSSTEDIISEYDVWKHHKNDMVGASLNPILFCSDYTDRHAYIAFSISPYVIPLDRSKPCHRNKKHFHHLKNVISNAICDGHSGNIGIINKLPVLIDYQDSFYSDFVRSKLSKEETSLMRKQHKVLSKLCLKACA